MTSFASDNYAPVHPEVMAAIDAANTGAAPAYGADPWTRRLDEHVREIFGAGTTCFPVLTGTGANVVSLMAVSPRWGGVVTSRWAHIENDENGAPERVGGLKVLTVNTADGKLTATALDRFADDVADVHRAQPAVLSLTQSTELGTVYTPSELRAITDAAHARGAVVHMDGSRLANAAAYLGTGLREITRDVGIDILSLGGTKNGAMLGEAVVVLDSDAAAHAVPYLRKMTMQLASKQRFVSAQLLALLSDEGDPEPLWMRNARHSNAMAALLRERVDTLAQHGIHATQPTEANAVFAVLPRSAATALRETYHFYDWGPGPTPDTVEVRWMCAWDTTEADVEGFTTALAASTAARA